MSELRVALPEARGDDPISGSVLAHQPEALAAFNRLYGILWSRGEVDQFTKELARIRNARLVNCTICKAIRFSGARAEGLGEDVVDLIHDGYAEGPLAPRHKVVLRLTDAFLAGGDAALPEELRTELLRHYTPSQIVELGAAIALFMGFSKIAVALGGLPDRIPVHEQPTPEPPAEET